MDKIVCVKEYGSEKYVENRRDVIYKEFEQDFLGRVGNLIKVRITKRLFFKILPCLEQKLTREQLKKVLCEFEPYELDAFYSLYVKEELREMLDQALDTFVRRIMVDVEKEFQKTSATLINIITQIFKHKDE